MAALKKYVVAHKSLYLRVNNKLQEIEHGSTVELDPKQAAKMLAKGMITDPSDKGSVKPGDGKKGGANAGGAE